MQNYPDLIFCQQLKSLGAPQESEKWWIRYLDGAEKEHWEIVKKNNGCLLSRAPSCSAYLSDELLEMLPDVVEVEDSIWDFYMLKDERGYLVGYSYNDDVLSEELPVIDKIFCNALSKLIIYLCLNGYQFNAGKLEVRSEKS